jgi:hypothetical protein
MSDKIREQYLYELRNGNFPATALTNLLNDARSDKEREVIISAVQDLRSSDFQVRKIEKIMNAILIKIPDGEKFVACTESTRELETLSKSTLSTIFSKKGLNNLISKNLIVCGLSYHPGRSEKIFMDWDDREKFNMYQPPSWRAPYFGTNIPLPTTKLPDIVHKLCVHLTGGERESYEYLLDWCANSFNFENKNRCYLVLIGVQGLGKNVFAKLMRLVHGSQNYREMNFSALAESHTDISRCTFLLLDECKIYTREEEDSAKSLTNDLLLVNEKNIPKYTVQNFASVYMATNHLHALRLSADDRRYSILDTNKDTLQTFLNREYAGNKDAFFTELYSESVVRDFGLYLLNRNVTRDMKVPFKSKTAVAAMHASTVDWEHSFLSELCLEFAGKEMTIKDAEAKMYEEYGQKIKLSSAGLSVLSSKYPGIFEVKKRTVPDEKGKRPLTIYIKDLSEQVKYEGINEETV